MKRARQRIANRKYRLKNLEKRKACCREYRKNNLEQMRKHDRELKRQLRLDPQYREKQKGVNKKSYYKHQAKRLCEKQEYYKENKPRLQIYKSEWTKLNREKINERRRNDPKTKIRDKHKNIIKKIACEKCGSKEELQNHHLEYVDDVKKVKVLCRQHHCESEGRQYVP